MNSQPTLFAQDKIDLNNLNQDICEQYDAFQTPRWAVEAMLTREYPHCLASAKPSRTVRVLDPCYGLGMITRTVLDLCPKAFVFSGDIINWRNQRHFNQGDFLRPESANWIGQWKREGRQWDCLMNPPFSLSVEFIERALELGAHKVCVFEKMSLFESASRKKFWDRVPLTRILYLAQRATCKRFDIIDKKMSTTEKYAWFIFEPNTKHIPQDPTIRRIYR